MSHPARSTSRVLASPTVAIVGGGGRSGTQAPAGATAKASEKDRARDGCEEEPGTPRRVRGRDRAGFARARPVGVARGAAVTRDGKAAGDGPAANRVVAGAGRRGGVVAARRRGVAVGGGGATRGRSAPAERVPGERVRGERAPGNRAPGQRAPRPRAPGQWASGQRICRERAPGDRIPGGRAAAERWLPAGPREVAGKRRVEAPSGIGRPRSRSGPPRG